MIQATAGITSPLPGGSASNAVSGMRNFAGSWNRNGVIPDLKRSACLNNAAAWKTMVEEGALQRLGTIGCSHLLLPGRASTIRQFVRNESRRARAAAPVPAGPPMAR